MYGYRLDSSEMSTTALSNRRIAGDLPTARDQGVGDAALVELLKRPRVHHEGAA